MATVFFVLVSTVFAVVFGNTQPWVNNGPAFPNVYPVAAPPVVPGKQEAQFPMPLLPPRNMPPVENYYYYDDLLEQDFDMNGTNGTEVGNDSLVIDFFLIDNSNDTIDMNSTDHSNVTLKSHMEERVWTAEGMFIQFENGTNAFDSWAHAADDDVSEEENDEDANDDWSQWTEEDDEDDDNAAEDSDNKDDDDDCDDENDDDESNDNVIVIVGETQLLNISFVDSNATTTPQPNLNGTTNGTMIGNLTTTSSMSATTTSQPLVNGTTFGNLMDKLTTMFASTTAQPLSNNFTSNSSSTTFGTSTTTASPVTTASFFNRFSFTTRFP